MAAKNEIVISGDTAWVVLKVSGVEVGRVAIDVGDVDLVKRFGWRLDEDGRVSANWKKRDRWTKIRIHRLIMGLPAGEVDHIDGDQLNARRSNLRVVDRFEQNQNSKAYGASGHRNVYWDPKRKKYYVQAVVRGKKHWGGRFDDLEEAVVAASALRSRVMTHSVEVRHGR